MRQERYGLSALEPLKALTLVHENGSVNSCVGGLDLASSLAPADAHARSVEVSV